MAKKPEPETTQQGSSIAAPTKKRFVNRNETLKVVARIADMLRDIEPERQLKILGFVRDVLDIKQPELALQPGDLGDL